MSNITGSVNLSISGTNTGTSVSHLNLTVVGGNAKESRGVDLVLWCDPGTTADIPLFIRGDGVTPGAIPLGSSLNLHIERGPQGSVDLYLKCDGAEGSIPLFLTGHPGIDGSIPVYISGDGGTLAGAVDLSMPAVVGLTAADGSVDLILDAIGYAEGSIPCYISGFGTNPPPPAGGSLLILKGLLGNLILKGMG